MFFTVNNVHAKPGGFDTGNEYEMFTALHVPISNFSSNLYCI